MAGLKPGRASTLTRLEDGSLLRHGGNPAYEAAVMEYVRSFDYPVPAVYDVRPDALVLEWIEGPTMQRSLEGAPWRLSRHMRTLAELHHRLHEIPAADGDGVVLHLDLHPLNVLLGPSGPLVIDWTNASSGEAALDPALTAVIFRTSSAPVVGRLATRSFLRHFDRSSVDAALSAACAYRLADPNLYDEERPRVERLALRGI